MFKPKYQIINSILNNLTRIAEVRSLVSHTSILPKEEARLKRQALIRMVHHSTSIEGNILNIREVEKVLKGEKVDVPERDKYEVENYRNAINFISQLVEKKKKISTKTILDIHRLVTQKTLTEDKCGKFRKDQVYVVKRRGAKITEIVYTGPSAKEVSKLVEDLMKWLRKTKKENVNPVIVAGLAHYQLATIHPFADGNGRTARLLATLVLYQRGYDFRKLFALEDYYNKNRPAYYKAIHTGDTYKERERVDLTNWLKYFVEGFASEMENVREKIIPLSLDEKMRKKIGQVYLDKDQIKIVDFIVSMGRVTRKDVEDVLGVSKVTAFRLIRELTKMGLIVRKGGHKKVYYVLSIFS